MSVCYVFIRVWQTAIRMYKLVGEERFLLWAVCSIQLQVRLACRHVFLFVYGILVLL